MIVRWLTIVLCLTPLASSGELVLHYTFDNADRDGLTLFDVAGSADAQVFGAVGVGALGEINEAIWLPNDDGNSYVELPAAQNPIPSGSDERTIAFWFNQLQVGSENKMFGYGTGGVGSAFEVSLEGGGVRLRYSGGNVTWGNGFDFTGSDAGWRHVAIRVNEGATSYLDVDVLLDGLPLVGVPTAGSPGSTPINTGGGAPSTLNLGRSAIFDPDGDFIGLLDDFRVYDTALTDQAIAALAGPPETLLVDVDPVTGAVSLRNPTDEPITLDYYELTSPAGALSGDDWVSLESQDRAGFPAGTGVGDGWETLGLPSSESLAEGRLLGLSALEPGQAIGIGNAYTPGMPLDMTLTYRSEGVFRTGRIGVVESGAPADYNADGMVDAADYTAWRDALGTGVVLPNDPTPGDVSSADGFFWATRYGAAINAAAVPEPATFWTLAALVISVASFRRVAAG